MVLEFVYLAFPQSNRFLLLFVVGEIRDDQRYVIGQLILHQIELEVGVIGSHVRDPLESDGMVFFSGDYTGALLGSVPLEDVIAFPYDHFICKPLFK